MHTSSFRSLALVLSAGVATASSAAVITNPATVTGAGAIDPANAQMLDGIAAGSATEGRLEGFAGFQAIQNFSGFTGPTAAGASSTNFFDFITAAIATAPDIAFTVSGNTTNKSGVRTAFDNDPYYTSPGNGLDLEAGAGGITLAIDFGTYDATTGTLVPGLGVAATGFTLSNIRAGTTARVRFLNAAGVVLSAQAQAGANTDTADAVSGTNGTFPGIDTLFGYVGSGLPTDLVTRIEIDRPSGNFIDGFTFDDFGFSSAVVVPEPASLALVGAGAALVLGRRRRA